MKLSEIINKVNNEVANRNNQNGIYLNTYGRPTSNSGLGGLVNNIKDTLANGGNVESEGRYFPYGDGTNDGNMQFSSGRFVSRKTIENRFHWGNEYGTQAPGEVFVDGFEDPASLTFKVEFGEWGASIMDQTTLAQIQRSSLETNAYYALNDQMPMGLLNLNFMTEEELSRNSGSQTQYNAYNYLLSRNEDRRAQYAKDFIEGLYIIQKDMKYMFSKISGLDKLQDFDALRAMRVKDCVIKLDCLPDGVDMKMRTLMHLYRNFVWDDVWQRWILPDIYRYFKMIIYVFDKRNLNQRYGQHNYAQDSFPIMAYECGPCEFVVSGLPDSEYTTDYMSTNTNNVSINIKVHNVKTYMANRMFNRVKFIKDLITSQDHKKYNDKSDPDYGQQFGWQFRWLQMMFMHPDEYYAYSWEGGSSEPIEHYVGNYSDFDSFRFVQRPEEPTDTWHYATVTDHPYIINSWKSLKRAVKEIITCNTRVIRDSRQPDKYYMNNDLWRIPPEAFEYYANQNWVEFDDEGMRRDMKERIARLLRQLKNFKLVIDTSKNKMPFTELDPDEKLREQNYVQLKPDYSKPDTIPDISLVSPDIADKPFRHMIIDDSHPDMDFLQLEPNLDKREQRYTNLEPDEEKMSELKPINLIDTEVPEMPFTNLDINIEKPEHELVEMIVNLDKPELAFVEMMLNLEKMREAMTELIVNLDKPDMEFVSMIPDLEHMYSQFVQMILYLDKREEEFTEMIPDLGKRKEEWVQLIPDLKKIIAQFVELNPDLEKPDMDYTNLIVDLNKAVMEYSKIIEYLDKYKGDFLQMLPNLDKAQLEMLQMYVDTSTGTFDMVRLIENLKKDSSAMIAMNIDDTKPKSDFIQMNPDEYHKDTNIELTLYDIKKENMEMIHMNVDSSKIPLEIQKDMLIVPVEDKHINRMPEVRLIDNLEPLESSAMIAMNVDTEIAHSGFIQMNIDDKKPEPAGMPELVENKVEHGEFIHMNPDDKKPEHTDMLLMNVDTEIAHSDFIQMNPDDKKPEHAGMPSMYEYTDVEHNDFIQMNVDASKPEHAGMQGMIINTEVEHNDFIQMNVDDKKPEHAGMPSMIDSLDVEHSQFIQMNPDNTKQKPADMPTMIEDLGVEHNDFIHMVPDDKKPKHADMLHMIEDTEVAHSDFIRMNEVPKLNSSIAEVALVEMDKMPHSDMPKMKDLDVSVAMSEVRLYEVEQLDKAPMIQMQPDDSEPEHGKFIQMTVDTSIAHSDMPHMTELDKKSVMSEVRLNDNLDKDMNKEINAQMHIDDMAKKSGILYHSKEESQSMLNSAKIEVSESLIRKISDIAMIDVDSIEHTSIENMIKLIDMLENTVNEAKREFKSAAMIVNTKKHNAMEFPQIVDPGKTQREIEMPDIVALERLEYSKRRANDKNNKD